MRLSLSKSIIVCTLKTQPLQASFVCLNHWAQMLF